MAGGMTGTACSPDWPSVSFEQAPRPQDGEGPALPFSPRPGESTWSMRCCNTFVAIRVGGILATALPGGP